MGKKLTKKQVGRQLLQANQKYINIFVLGAAFVIASYLYITSEKDSVSGETLNWRVDDQFNKKSANTECDFQYLDIGQLQSSHHLFSDDGTPVIIKDLAKSWKSGLNWQKQTFLNLYGNRTIQSGSESSIVYSGGSAGTPVLLREMIDQMGNNTFGIDTDDFVFDASILQSVPELLHDIQVPHLMRDWDTPQNERDGLMWHMLSMGPSRTGSNRGFIC